VLQRASGQSTIASALMEDRTLPAGYRVPVKDPSPTPKYRGPDIGRNETAPEQPAGLLTERSCYARRFFTRGLASRHRCYLQARSKRAVE
jgi:hypothetical protein